MHQQATQKPITDYIPPEIIDAIIDCLHNDKASLCSCSLVCRLFRPRTRVNLFRTLELKLDGTRDINPDVPSFRDIIEYIKEIKLQGVGVPLQLPSISSNSLTTFLNLSSLSLSFVVFRDPWHLHALISHLPGLTGLDLKNVFFENQSISESESKLLPTINLKRISIYGTSFNQSVVEALFHRADLRATYVDSLHELRIDYPPAEYLSSICTFVGAASESGSLKSFDIRFRYGAYTPGLWSSWPAQPDRLLLTMPTLHVEMKCDLYCDWHIRVMRWLVHSLSNSPPGAARLETLALTVIPPYNHYKGEHWHTTLEDEDWAAQWSILDQVLVCPELLVFRRLKVAFKLYQKGSSPWRGGPYSREWVKEKLPLLEKKGMLEVDVIKGCVV